MFIRPGSSGMISCITKITFAFVSVSPMSVNACIRTIIYNSRNYFDNFIMRLCDWAKVISSWKKFALRQIEK